MNNLAICFIDIFGVLEILKDFYNTNLIKYENEICK